MKIFGDIGGDSDVFFGGGFGDDLVGVFCVIEGV